MSTFRLIKLNAFRILLSVSILIFSTARVMAQSTADPAYANMQRAMGGITQQVAEQRGYSTKDPRTFGTLYGMGKAASSQISGVSGIAAGAATAGLLVGTAPAWVTLLAVLTVGAIVNYAVSLALDHLTSWIFGSNSVQVPNTGVGNYTTTAYPDQILPAALINSVLTPTANATVIAGANTYFTKSQGNVNCSGIDFLAVYYCYYDALSGTYDQSTITTPVQYLAKNFPALVGSYVGGVNVTSSASSQYITANVGYGYLSSLSSGTYTPALDVVMTAVPGIQYGVQCSTGYASFNNKPCKRYSTNSTIGSPFSGMKTTTMTAAVNLLTPAQLAQPVDYGTMAFMVNTLWQKAAADPTYSGIPYSATQPVTAADVQTWAQANPSSYPTVASLVAPVTDVTTGFVPSTTTATGTTTTPATGSTPSTGTNSGQNGTVINLGVDPNIGAPTLEAIPTASAILSPILNLFPSFKNFVVPSHTAICPTPTFDAFGKHFVMDTHCTLFEQQRSTLYSTMVLAFMLVAIFIVLSA